MKDYYSPRIPHRQLIFQNSCQLVSNCMTGLANPTAGILRVLDSQVRQSRTNGYIERVADDVLMAGG
jgi:hypothetical protein